MHPEEYEDFFFNRLIKLRMKKGNSARDMSLSMGQSKGYMTSIENKKSYPSFPMFFVICDYLGVTPVEFFNTDSNFPVEVTEMITTAHLLNDKELSAINELMKIFSQYKQKTV